jgi:anti-sigma B factor antagonist
MTEELAKFHAEELAGGITEIKVVGRMDIKGVFAIEDDFAKVAEEKSKVLVNMEEVSFLASLGIRTLVMTCKAVAAKGGDLVLLNPQANVDKVLKSSGIDQAIKIFTTRDEALAYLGK